MVVGADRRRGADAEHDPAAKAAAAAAAIGGVGGLAQPAHTGDDEAEAAAVEEQDWLSRRRSRESHAAASTAK